MPKKKLPVTKTQYKTLVDDCLKLISEYKLLFINDLIALLPFSKSTFYVYGLDKSEAVKEAIENNRSLIKQKLRAKWYESTTPTLQIALYKAQEPIILMTHNPDIFEDFVPQNVALTLSGHTHGGQVVIPFIGALIVPSSYGKKYANGLITEHNKKILITKGLGTTIFPIRFIVYRKL